MSQVTLLIDSRQPTPIDFIWAYQMPVHSLTLQCLKAVFFSSILFAALPAAAQDQTVWQIGVFDRSPLEFTDSSPAKDVTFVVGKSDWKTNWPGRQPVDTPYKVSFTLNSLSGLYTLKIATLIERPRVP